MLNTEKIEALMITKITGTPVHVAGDVLTLAVGAFEYEILIPEFARRNLQDQIGREVSLHTVEYLEGNAMQGRLTPRLVGFLNPIEREFFDMFCEVDGVGVKKALRAMVRPVQEVAAHDRRAGRQRSGDAARHRPGDGRADHRQAAAQSAEIRAAGGPRNAAPVADIERDLLVAKRSKCSVCWATARPTPADCWTAHSTRRQSTKTSTRCCTRFTKRRTANELCVRCRQSIKAK